MTHTITHALPSANTQKGSCIMGMFFYTWKFSSPRCTPSQLLKLVLMQTKREACFKKKKQERRYPNGECTAGTGSTWTTPDTDTCALALRWLLRLVRSACIGRRLPCLSVRFLFFLVLPLKLSVMLASRPRSMASVCHLERG
jgi:hypothetical protein